MKKMLGPRWLKVNDRKNSDCNYPLEELDWSNWFMDAWHTEAWRYIHVRSLEHDSIQRVYPKQRLEKYGPVRLGMKDGQLYWLTDRKAQP